MLSRIAIVVSLAFAQAGQSAPFTSPVPVADLRGKQAVVTTSAGVFVIDLLADAAPNHVAFFIKQAREGSYEGTIFHSVIGNAIMQGGDPFSRDLSRRSDYGQGGFNQIRAEANDEKQTPGTVSSVRPPSDSRVIEGSQFFIAVTDQPSLEGQHTVFGRVVEGIEVVQRISVADADGTNQPLTRIEILSIAIRDTPPVPFVEVDDDAAAMSRYRAVLETTMGEIELSFLTDKAPETVRAFLRRAHAGVYDGIAVHRVAPNFVIQTGAIGFRQMPLTAVQQKLIFDLPPEFSDVEQIPGIVSMARGEDPNSASTSFFICTGSCRSLDGKYTAFARVTTGGDVLARIATVPVEGETPVAPITVTRVRLVRD